MMIWRIGKMIMRWMPAPAFRSFSILLGLLFVFSLYCGGSIGGCSSTTTSGGGSSGGAGGSGGSTTDGGSSTGGTTAGGDVTGSSPVSSSGSFTASNGFSQQTLTVDGVGRPIALYAPASRGSSPALVIAFHGTSGEQTDWIDSSASSDLAASAAANGFVVAAPRARDWGDGASDWDNHGGNDRFWETRFDANPSRGSDPNANADLVLVKQIIASTHATFNVDLNRVYLIGFSNGAFFSLHAAMILRDQIAAFAEAAGGLVKCDRTDSCLLQSSSTDCGTISSGCSCTGDEKPTAIPTTGRQVPGILGHNNRDDGVSVFYDCALSSRMQALGYDVSEHISNDSGHGIPTGFVDAAWTFFSTHSLP